MIFFFVNKKKETQKKTFIAFSSYVLLLHTISWEFCKVKK